MTKSAKLSVENLGEPYKEICEFLQLEGSVSLNPLRKKNRLANINKEIIYLICIIRKSTWYIRARTVSKLIRQSTINSQFILRMLRKKIFRAHDKEF
jgi:hypothetical protein